MDVKEAIEGLIKKFNERVEEDARLRQELEGLERKVQIDLGDQKYFFLLEDCRVHSFSEGTIESPDVTIISDPDTMEGLISKRISPMKALALRRLKLKGDIEDLLKFRKFF